jgi:4-hydroxy-tetrahydrodipicolinate synthase
MLAKVEMIMDPFEFKRKCKGIIPVQFCPYTDDHELDINGLKENTEFLVDFAMSGKKDMLIMTNGSTTEFYANSIEEQRNVIKTVVETVDGRVPVIAGTGQPGTKETLRMTRYAEEVGADCAVVISPYYFTPTKEGLYQHYKKIAESAKIAIMLYNYPDVSGTMIDPSLTQRLSKIENIVALKDNSPSVGDYFAKATMIDQEGMVLLCGLGETAYVGAAAYGFRYKGLMTVIGNFAPSLSYSVYEAIEERDFVKAYEALKKLLPLVGLFGKFMGKRESPSITPSILRTNYMYMSVLKACMDLVGLKGGPLRMPMEDLTTEEKKEVREALISMGVI